MATIKRKTNRIPAADRRFNVNVQKRDESAQMEELPQERKTHTLCRGGGILSLLC
jgi:hypothetical protein